MGEGVLVRLVTWTAGGQGLQHHLNDCSGATPKGTPARPRSWCRWPCCCWAGWAWIAAVHARRRPAAALAIGCLALVLVACLAARDVPTLLRDYSMDTLRVVTRLERSHPETTPAVPRRALRSPAAGHPGPGRS